MTLAILQFFETGKLLKEINCTTVTLIPKVVDPNYMKEFRPIACCSTVYKLISKILASRLKRVVDYIVGNSQSAFIEGRTILDNVIIAHELVKGYSHNGVSPRCILNVDIRKAYDSVEWGFLKMLLLEFGFPAKFVQLLMECVSTVSYSLLINEGLTPRFQAKKGLRQGYPMSPYLFVLAMEYLNRSLKQLRHNPDFNYHPKCGRMKLVHICFADDLLMCCITDKISIHLMLQAFHHFSDVSGLRANMEKSSLYIAGVSQEFKNQILEEMQFSQGEMPFKYLGVPLSSKKITVQQCQPLVEKIIVRIRCSSTKFLSYSGRAQLIKSVLFEMQTYWAQVFQLPKKVIKQVTSICRVFLGTRKHEATKRALISWEKLCMPRSAGGLNIIYLYTWNKAAICKILWAIAEKKDTLWIQWVHSFYIKSNALTSIAVPKQASWIVRKIIEAREWFPNVDPRAELQRYCINGASR